MNELTNTLKTEFLDKEYAHAYTEDFLNASIATQIKVLREQKEWTQDELATHAGMQQARISLLENVNYSSWSINTLRKLAKAFDLTLRVTFENFSTRIRDIEGFSREALQRTSREDDQHQVSPDEQFAQLAEKWKAETGMMSNISHRIMHQAYQQIIRMGAKAIPFMLKDFQNGDFEDWFDALSKITRADPVSPSALGDVESMAKAWIQWGQQNSYLRKRR